MIPKLRVTRRSFLNLMGTAGFLSAVPVVRAQTGGEDGEPWYRRTFRWGQTNINERDPERYDIDWWRRHWKLTRTQGLVINAGGIVAYYPSKNPLQYRAQYLGERDLYGELVRAAHEDGLAVLARMDSNRATEEFFREHEDWFAVDAEGDYYRAADRYISCIDSPYYEEYLPSILREIIAWEKPEGFTDNSWSGLNRDQICYCRYSREKFREATGLELPREKNWDDPVYRQWIEWSYQRRVAIWDLNNRTVQEAAGPDCIWLGMLGGDLISQGERFRDIRSICRRSEMVMLDDQSRSVGYGFQENAEMGKRLHGLLGWEKVIPESMAMYQRSPTFRKAAASPAEARAWMLCGFSGTIQPWWHHVGAYQWDRRQFETARELYGWYSRNEPYLVRREPVASVGLVYSQRNADFYGRDEAEERVGHPYYGFVQALVRRRIPYLPVHIDDLPTLSSQISLLILPNLALLTDEQAASIQAFAERGGSIIATGEMGYYDRWGDRREKILLTELLGARPTGEQHGTLGSAQTWEALDHSYLRLDPPVGKDVYGPLSGEEPVLSKERHPLLEGFEKTDILPFGGLLIEVEPAADAEVVGTLIPSFPAYPPETSWMREPRTGIPAVVVRSHPAGGRIVYFAADLDRRFSRDHLPDHGDLLANAVGWASFDRLPLRVKGAGLINCDLYRQERRMVLHLVNLSGAGAWRSPLEELNPAGPFAVHLKLSEGVGGSRARELVSGRVTPLARVGDEVAFEIASLADHEVVVIE